jgi:hypothetical protein
MTVLTRSEYLPLSVVLAMVSTAALATTFTYTIDPNHTHPSFEADHFNGLSIWRGVFKNTSGTVTVDAAAGTGGCGRHLDVAWRHQASRFAHRLVQVHFASPAAESGSVRGGCQRTLEPR